MELRNYGIMELRKIGFALLRQTTRQLVNETTSGAVAGLQSRSLVDSQSAKRQRSPKKLSSFVFRLRSVSEAHFLYLLYFLYSLYLLDFCPQSAERQRSICGSHLYSCRLVDSLSARLQLSLSQSAERQRSPNKKEISRPRIVLSRLTRMYLL